MKKRTRLLLTSCAVAASALALTSCGGGSHSSVSTYKTYYTSEFETLNYLVTQSAGDHEYTANCVDGLLDTDRFGKLTPTLATEIPTGQYDATTDTTTFTFNLRTDSTWVDYEGNYVANVTANDWVSSAKYVLNYANVSDTYYMLTMFIVGAEEYYYSTYLKANLSTEDATKLATYKEKYGVETWAEAQNYFAQGYGFENWAAVESTTFENTVKVTAVNDYTLEYVVMGNTPYFITALSYCPYYPVYGPFVEQQGSDFGMDKENILYNGAYRMVQHVTQNEIIMEANDTYWDKEHVFIKTIRWTYVNYANVDADTLTRTLYENKQIDGFVVNKDDTAGWEKYVAGSDGTGTLTAPVSENAFTATSTSPYVYHMIWNFDRRDTIATDISNYGSNHTAESYANTFKAILNANFRLAFVHGFDFTYFANEYYGYYYESAHRAYTPSGLGTAETGKDYTAYFAAEYASKQNISTEAAENYLYPNAEASAETDVVLNKTLATQYADAAYTELSAEGVTFPVKVEIYGSTNPVNNAQIEQIFSSLGGNIKTSAGVQLFDFVAVQPTSQTSSAMSKYGCYDLYPTMGWGPDYAYPTTYLNTYKVGGDMISYSGFTGYSEANDALQEQILGPFTEKLNAALAMTTNSDAQYKAFAEAEYELLFNSAVIIPYFNISSTNVRVTKLVPYSSFRGTAGISSYKMKYATVADHPITQAEFQALRDAFRAGDADALQSVINDVVSGKYLK